MDLNKVCAKIKLLGHANSKREDLREYCKLKIDVILKHVSRWILGSDGADLLDCVLNGLPDALGSTKNKIKVIDLVLQCLREESTSLTHCGDVISRVCLELPRVPTPDVVRWCNDSIQSLVDDSDVNMIWRDVLPECLSVILEGGNVLHCGTELSAEEFREQCVRTLCQCRWTQRSVVQLAAMFKDMQLSRADHRQVVNKLCSLLVEMPPDCLPPLVHQLLKLCKMHDMEVVLSYLSHYFQVKLYSALRPPLQDSESTNMDLDDIGTHTSAELSSCLSTCVYHMCKGAAELELLRRHLKQWPRTLLLRSPFLLSLALGLSDQGRDSRSVCLALVKSAIQQRITDDLKCRESAWLRSILPTDVDTAAILKILVAESINHRQLTVSGLINLAFSLLATSPLLGREAMALACWSHAKLILVRLAMSQPETAGHILGLLSDKLAADSTMHRQYSDCLHILCKLTPLSLERCPQLCSILEYCQASNGDYRSPAAVLEAVHPLLNFSTRVRDTLVMVCRKGLFSRDSSSRCLALSGFLSLLHHMNLPRGSGDSSQSHSSEQFSAHSYLTQISIDLHATQQGTLVSSRVHNETVCMEVVSILRRCLVQDAAVKQLLYSSIYECAKNKPSIHEPILELLYEHLTKFVSADAEGGPPLALDSCAQTTATSAVLLEPIGHLLCAAQQFLQPTQSDDSEDLMASPAEGPTTYLKNKLGTLMLQVSDKFAGCQLSHFDMDGETGLTDLTPESKAKAIKIQQALQCYEALLAYCLTQWNADSSDASSRFYSLFKGYSQLLEHTKVPPKLGKKTSKTSLNETKESQKAPKSQKSGKEKGKRPIKLSALSKDRAGRFKPLPCLWNLALCARMLELLYSDEVAWSSAEQRSQVRVKRDVHQYALRSVQAALAGAVHRRDLASHGVQVATILFQKCIKRFEDVCDFDEPTALACVEVFRDCLAQLLALQLALKPGRLMQDITGISEESAANGAAVILECVVSGLLQLDAESDSEAEQDAVTRKLVLALAQLAVLLLDKIQECSPSLTTVTVRLEEYVRSSKRDCLVLVPALLNAARRISIDGRLLDELLLKLTGSLGKIDEEDTSTAPESELFPFLRENVAPAAHAHVCAVLGALATHTEYAVARARDLHQSLSYCTSDRVQHIDTMLLELNKSIVVQLCRLSGCVGLVASLRCASGAGGERALQAGVRLYTLLSGLAELLTAHATAHHLHAIRFERLLKLCGKKLSAVVDNLITYLENVRGERAAARVLKDSRLVPRLVFESEQFCKQVMLLSKKTKLNLQQYMSLGTARDFRIQAPALQEALNGQAQDADVSRVSGDQEGQDEEVNINEAETEILSGASVEESSDEEGSVKRRRLS